MKVTSDITPKLIVMDLDGTALNSSNEIPENLHNILSFLKDNRGYRIILASGRSVSSMKPIAEKLRLKAPLITLNGGVIIDPVSDEIHFEKNLGKKIYSESIKILQDLSMNFVIFTSNVVYAESPSHITEILKKYTDNTIEWIDNYHTVKLPVKILFIPESEEAVNSIKKHTQHLDIDIIDSGFRFVEIVPKGVNKGAALKMVSEKLGIGHRNIIAFGDNENDIEMLQYAGTGIAMGNAPDHVKAEADFVTDTNDNDGVYKILEQILNPAEENIQFRQK